MSERQFATFYLGPTLWGIDILQIREVIRTVTSWSVPHAPRAVHGLMNLRGRVATVIDLSVRLGRQSESNAADGNCVILRTDVELEALPGFSTRIEPVGNDTVGLLVDRMSHIIHVGADQIQASPANTGSEEQPFVRGVLELERELMLELSLQQSLALTEGEMFQFGDQTSYEPALSEEEV